MLGDHIVMKNVSCLSFFRCIQHQLDSVSQLLWSNNNNNNKWFLNGNIFFRIRLLYSYQGIRNGQNSIFYSILCIFSPICTDLQKGDTIVHMNASKSKNFRTPMFKMFKNETFRNFLLLQKNHNTYSPPPHIVLMTGK